MNAISLDFSQRPDLALHAAVIADVQRAASAERTPTMIAGALARDLHVYYRYGIDTHRSSEDIDFGVAVEDWRAFDSLRNRLLGSAVFRSVENRPHRLRHVESSLPVDLVPFSGVETRDRRIEWPPRGETVMDAFGFREALATAIRARFPGGIEADVVSLPGLTVLKLVAWRDRHIRSPRKDAHDLMVVASNYLRLGHEQRLWEEFEHWTQEAAFDYRESGARMLGHDVRAMLSSEAAGHIASLLEDQARTGARAGQLAAEMNVADPEDAANLPRAMSRGFTEFVQA